MNKGISLAIVGVLLCAMGIIFFMSLNADNDEQRLAQTSQETIFPDRTTERPEDKGYTQPLIADQNASQNAGQKRATSPIPPQTTQRLDKTPVTPPPVTTPPVKKIEPAQTPAQTPAQKTTPPQAKVQTPPAQPAQSTQSGQSGTPPAKTETPPARQETPVKPEPSQQSGTQAPSLKPLETQPSQSQATTTAAQTTTDSHTLSKIGLHFRGNDIYLRIEADSAFKEKVFALPGPDRLVVDLLGKWNNVTAPSIPSNQLVTRARVGQQPNATRLVLDLSRKTTFTVHKINDNVVEILMR